MYFDPAVIRIMEPHGPDVIAVELCFHIDDILQAFFDAFKKMPEYRPPQKKNGYNHSWPGYTAFRYGRPLR